MKSFSINEINFLKENYPKYGAQFCSKNLNRSNSSIRHKANRLGLKVSNNTISNIMSNNAKKNTSPKYKNFDEYSVNPKVFIKHFNETSAYILGLLWADGHIVYKKNRCIIRLENKIEDSKIFYKIFLETGDWKFYSLYRNNKQYGLITTSNRVIVEFLAKNDYVSKTSPEKILSVIPKKLHNHWIRGFIDGDGGWYFNKKLYKRIFHVTGAFDTNWNFFTNILDDLDIKYSLQYKVNNNHRASCVYVYSKKLLKKLGDFIYKSDKDCNHYLDRKYQIWKKMII
jgi:intein-encoded DNA endonuclease-like protein